MRFQAAGNVRLDSEDIQLEYSFMPDLWASCWAEAPVL